MANEIYAVSSASSDSAVTQHRDLSFHRIMRKVMLFLTRGLVACLMAGLFLLCLVPEGVAEQKVGAPQKTLAPLPAPAPSGPGAISVANIATEATEVASLLQAITQQLAPSAQVEIIRESLPDVSQQVVQDLSVTMGILQRQQPLSMLQEQHQRWHQMQMKNTDWLTVLTKRSNALQEALDRLAGSQKRWEMTLEASRASRAPGPTLEQIVGTLASIKAVQSNLQSQLTSVLDLQSAVSVDVEKCEMALARIAEAQRTSVSGLLVRDSPPILSLGLWAEALSRIPMRVRDVDSEYTAEVIKYFRDPSEHLPLHVGIFAVLTLLFLMARHLVRKRTENGETFSPSVRVLDHPVAAALTVTLQFATSPYWLLPIILRVTLQVLVFAPMIVLIRPVVSKRLLCGIYLLWIFFTIDAVRQIFSADPLIGQGILIIESLGGLAAMIWFSRDFGTSFGVVAGSSRMRVLQTGLGIILLLFASGFAEAAMGYLRLARLTTPGVLVGGALALAIYAALRVAMGIVTLASNLWPFRTLGMVLHHRDMLERRLYRFLVWVAIVGWTARYLSYVGFLGPVLTFGKAVLNASFERGAFRISLGDIIEFVLTVWVAYLLSGFIRFILDEDVYPRMKIASGKAYSVSSLLHYFILALGFTAAMAALGVNLTKLTVLTGALGVGIGFGLQGVVNNFVSGLILLFERPIHVGDVVEVGDLLGKVRTIGIRASTVHTRQGADIVVPNSQLVTEKVTNWTLSDQLRRLDLPVGVNYGASPKAIIKLLEAVARNHPQILQDPAPQGLFVGYGDSSINFELRAWTDQFDDWSRVRSELAVAVYDAVYEAGMTFPFPQREVRVLRDSAGGETESPPTSFEKE